MDPAADAYALLDAGAGRRLERFGDVILDRPAPWAVSAPREDPEAWRRATARFQRVEGAAGGTWEPAGALPDRWTISLDDLELELRPTPAGQVGLFPDHLAVARWAATQAATAAAGGRPAEVLNLFAYTVLATLLVARAGARVAHVDASRPAVAWARRNAALAGFEERPIRWLVEDAARFVAREVRRGRRYDGVILDPPTYGHGPDGTSWRLDDGLEPLLAGIRPLLDPRSAFVACTAHATGLEPGALERLVRDGLDLGRRSVDVRQLALGAANGVRLVTGWAVLVDAIAAGEGR
jgi:23S rRNA (cytosine1962-C5)-methyltransferase